MSKKKTHTSNSKERILQTAISLFARKGFAETGMRELATKAEVNLSMVNYFFGNKKELLKKILDGFLSEYLAIAREELAGKGDLQCKLEHFIAASVNYFETEQDPLIITISELPHDDPEIVEHKASWARQMVEIVDRELCLPHGEKTGQYIPATCLAPMLTSLMASRFLFGPLMEEVKAGSSRAISTEEYTEMLVGILLQGITGTGNKSNEGKL